MIGTYVRIKPEYRHHYGDEAGAMWIVEAVVDFRDRADALGAKMLAGMGREDLTRVVAQPVWRIRKVDGDSTWVYAPASWIEEAGQPISGGGGSGTGVIVLPGSSDDDELRAIADLIRTREQRVLRDAVSMRDEYERRAIEAEQRSRELIERNGGLIETCQQRNVTINTLRAELERERDTSFANIRNVQAQGGMVLTAAEVRTVSRIRPNLRTATWNQVFDHVMNELEKDVAQALLAKLTLLGFSGA